MPKQPLGINVLDAAQQRIAWTFDTFERVCVSFSGGKDSTVMLHLAMEEAIKRGRKVGLLFIDMEGQYQATVEHIEAMYQLYQPHVEPYWIALPLILRNAVSMFQPRWLCWNPDERDQWIRHPPAYAITDEAYFPWFKRGMEPDEVLRLKQITGLAELFADKDYSEAWK